MSDYSGFKEIGVSLDGMVATVEIRRPPNNFFDAVLIAEIGEAFERLDADPACRAIVLAALSRVAADHADALAEIDLNPVIVHEAGGGVSVVDALIVKR